VDGDGIDRAAEEHFGTDEAPAGVEQQDAERLVGQRADFDAEILTGQLRVGEDRGAAGEALGEEVCGVVEDFSRGGFAELLLGVADEERVGHGVVSEGEVDDAPGARRATPAGQATVE
jgi:hypothetical protein